MEKIDRGISPQEATDDFEIKEIAAGNLEKYNLKSMPSQINEHVDMGFRNLNVCDNTLGGNGNLQLNGSPMNNNNNNSTTTNYNYAYGKHAIQSFLDVSVKGVVMLAIHFKILNTED